MSSTPSGAIFFCFHLFLKYKFAQKSFHMSKCGYVPREDLPPHFPQGEGLLTSPECVGALGVSPPNAQPPGGQMPALYRYFQVVPVTGRGCSYPSWYFQHQEDWRKRCRHKLKINHVSCLGPIKHFIAEIWN